MSGTRRAQVGIEGLAAPPRVRAGVTTDDDGAQIPTRLRTLLVRLRPAPRATHAPLYAAIDRAHAVRRRPTPCALGVEKRTDRAESQRIGPSRRITAMGGVHGGHRCMLGEPDRHTRGDRFFDREAAEPRSQPWARGGQFAFEGTRDLEPQRRTTGKDSASRFRTGASVSSYSTAQGLRPHSGGRAHIAETDGIHRSKRSASARR